MNRQYLKPWDNGTYLAVQEFYTTPSIRSRFLYHLWSVVSIIQFHQQNAGKFMLYPNSQKWARHSWICAYLYILSSKISQEHSRLYWRKCGVKTIDFVVQIQAFWIKHVSTRSTKFAVPNSSINNLETCWTVQELFHSTNSSWTRSVHQSTQIEEVCLGSSG